MSCASCGRDVRRGALFCAGCGAALAEAATEEPARAREEPVPAPASRPLDPWSVARPALLFFGVFVAIAAALVIGVRIDPSSMLPLELVASIAHLVVAVAFALGDSATRGSQLRLLTRTGLTARAAGQMLATLVFMVVFITLYLRALRLIGATAVPMLTEYRAAGWPLWSAFVLVCVVAPVAEELGFRGYVYERFARVAGERDALMIQAALFSIAHLLPMSLVSHFVMGIAFGALRRWTNSLFPSMVVHGAYNAAVLTIELYAQ